MNASKNNSSFTIQCSMTIRSLLGQISSGTTEEGPSLILIMGPNNRQLLGRAKGSFRNSESQMDRQDEAEIPATEEDQKGETECSAGSWIQGITNGSLGCSRVPATAQIIGANAREWIQERNFDSGLEHSN